MISHTEGMYLKYSISFCANMELDHITGLGILLFDLESSEYRFIPEMCLWCQHRPFQLIF